MVAYLRIRVNCLPVNPLTRGRDSLILLLMDNIWYTITEVFLPWLFGLVGAAIPEVWGWLNSIIQIEMGETTLGIVLLAMALAYVAGMKRDQGK